MKTVFRCAVTRAKNNTRHRRPRTQARRVSDPARCRSRNTLSSLALRSRPRIARRCKSNSADGATFPYYGGKRSLATKYPPAEHGIIVELFAGSAAYSMHHATPDTRVILCELNPKIYDVWKLLQVASEADVLALPILQKGASLDDYTPPLTETQKTVISLFSSPHSHPHTRNMVVSDRTKWNEKNRAMLAQTCNRIRKWEIYLGSYADLPQHIKSLKATWFCDPPYQSTPAEESQRACGGGYGPQYGSKALDFEQLRLFIKERDGLTIVCERTTATWMGAGAFKLLESRNYEEGVIVLRSGGLL
mgnify:CR=1 FL=1